MALFTDHWLGVARELGSIRGCIHIQYSTWPTWSSTDASTPATSCSRRGRAAKTWATCCPMVRGVCPLARIHGAYNSAWNAGGASGQARGHHANRKDKRSRAGVAGSAGGFIRAWVFDRTGRLRGLRGECVSWGQRVRGSVADGFFSARGQGGRRCARGSTGGPLSHEDVLRLDQEVPGPRRARWRVGETPPELVAHLVIAGVRTAI